MGELIDTVGIEETATGAAAYPLGTTDAELEHLVRQSEEWAPETEWLLDAAGVPRGGRVIDIACGAMGILHLLAARVGEDGEVVGLDREPRMLAVARDLAARRGLPVRLVEADAGTTGLPRGSFDLVHARTLLVNVPRPELIVREMCALARPGGVVALQEPDTSLYRCDPPHPDWDRLMAAFHAGYAHYGLDTHLGSRLPTLLREAELTGIEGRLVSRMTHPGDFYHTFLPTLIRLSRDRAVAAGVIGTDELARLLASVLDHLDQPGTVTSGVPLWQVWGRHP